MTTVEYPLVNPDGVEALVTETVTPIVEAAVGALTAADVGATTPSDVTTAITTALAGFSVTATTTRQLAVLKAGVPIGTFDFVAASGSVTCRVGYLVPSTGYADLELTYDNWTLQGTSGSGGSEVGGEADGANDLTLKATLEYGGVSTPLYWANGSKSLTIVPGGSATTLPIAVDLPAGASFYIRTYASYTPGTFPSSGYAPDAAVSGSGYSSGDTTASTGTMTNSSNNSGLVAPSIITGRPAAARAVVAILGDSLSTGTGDTLANGGYIRRGLGTIPNITLGRGSERASTTAPLKWHARRFRYLKYATHAVEEYGVNDIGNNQTLSVIQANRVALWTSCAAHNVKVYATTTTPSTSNDATKEGRRVQLNDWIRDGAPILNGVAVATGSNAGGTLRAGATGHPLAGYFEIADLAETARNSGTWRVGYSDDGTHPNPTGAAALAAGINTAVFTV